LNTPIRPRGTVAQQPKTPEELAISALDEPPPAEPSSESQGSSDASAEPPEKLSPLDRWKANLKAADITEDQANTILDAIITQGHYAQDYKLLHGRLRVRLRTRSASTLRRVGDALDQVRTNDPRVHNQVMGRLLLIDSLASYNKTTFSFPAATAPIDEQQAAYKQRADAVDAMPGMIYDTLMATLSRFDTQVAAACSEGDVEGF